MKSVTFVFDQRTIVYPHLPDAMAQAILGRLTGSTQRFLTVTAPDSQEVTLINMPQLLAVVIQPADDAEAPEILTVLADDETITDL